MQQGWAETVKPAAIRENWLNYHGRMVMPVQYKPSPVGQRFIQRAEETLSWRDGCRAGARASTENMWGAVCFAVSLNWFGRAQEAGNKEKQLGFSLQKGLTATLLNTAASPAEAKKWSRGKLI